MKTLTHIRQWAHGIKRDIHAIYLASKDPRVPWYVKVLAICVIAYALSPIDLIPDFIPVLGYLDDVVLLPLGILLVIRLIPPDVMVEHRAAATAATSGAANRAGAAVVIGTWLLVVALVLWLLWPLIMAL